MRWSSALDALPIALDAVVEGAWLAIAYLVLQVLGAHGPILLGPIQFAALAAVGLLLGRGALPWTGGGGAVAVVAVAAALAGWLLAPEVRDALLANDLNRALGYHTGGWLAGVAVVRGAIHGESYEDDEVASRLLTWALPALAVPWLLAQAATPAARAAFAEPAFIATLTFAVTALLSLAVARLDALGAGSGLDWRRNRSWLLVLGLIVAGTVLVGLPLAAALGVPLEAAVMGALGPLWIAFAVVISVLAIPAGLLAAGLVALFRAILHPVQSPSVQAPAPAAVQNTQLTPGSGLVFTVVVVVAILGVLALAAWRLWPGRGPQRRVEDEERGIVIPQGSLHVGLTMPRWHRPPRVPAPSDAVTAYVATVDDLAGHPGLARAVDETPASHARRLRLGGRGMVPLDLLAADYQLARYAGRGLTRAEDRRGLARWRRVRAMAGAVSAGAGAAEASSSDSGSAGTVDTASGPTGPGSAGSGGGR